MKRGMVDVDGWMYCRGVYMGIGCCTLYTMVVWDGVKVEGGWVPLLKMSIFFVRYIYT